MFHTSIYFLVINPFVGSFILSFVEENFMRLHKCRYKLKCQFYLFKLTEDNYIFK